MNRSDCEALDRADPLAPKRAAFSIPEGLIYLDGNSLGVLPRNVSARVREVAEKQWGESLIKPWNKHGDDERIPESDKVTLLTLAPVKFTGPTAPDVASITVPAKPAG